MKRFVIPLIALSASGFGLFATAQSVTPMNGQSQQTMQQDMSACQSQAGMSGSSTTGSSQSGGRVRGAAKGAVAGATVAEVRGNRDSEIYDQLDSDVKQEHRQNQAKDAAVAGVVVGGSRQRQDRREDRRNSTDSASVYSTCMQQRGYQVTP
ncbi:hypothetical protein EGJ27_22470 [Pseudomonas sp. v388]|uniref:hypothetical protein n=1 Tax=Pseudomonas sp. v388 TaxID=2479849 RepID=UPI000F76F4D5|nr:hypothetical protein [Pseudomonas sp. v388]RRV04598.1 hypothetical protein EGJ27_22470 [Pseudomonas sp. v388]